MKVLKRIILITLIIISIGLISYAAYTFTATQVKYKKTSTTNITVQAALDELEGKAIKPKVGDIVNYNADKDPSTGAAFTTKKTYTTHNTDSTTDNEYTGSTTPTTFSSDDEATWKIMDINHDTGKILLMEAGSFTKTLELKGRAGYAYCENILNSASQVYGQGYGATGARSITVEDINAIKGFTPVTSGYGIHSQSYTSGSNFVDLQYENGKVKANSHAAKTASSSNPITVTADNSYDYTGTAYNKGVYLAKTSNTYKMIFYKTGTTTNRSYWFASRCMYFGSNFCLFRVRCIDDDGNVIYENLCFSNNSGEYGNSRAVCPVVSLNSNVQLSYVSTSNGISTWNIQ